MNNLIFNRWWRTGFIHKSGNKTLFPQTLQDEWYVEWDRASRKPNNFLQECILVAQHIGKEATQDIKILLSGGKDSEVIVRSFLKTDVPFSCVIMRFENDLNLFDISYGIEYCEQNGIDYEILDVSFFEYYVNDPTLHTQYSQFDRTTEYSSWIWATNGIEGTLICGNGVLLDFMFKTKPGLKELERFSAGNNSFHYDYVYNSNFVDDMQEPYQETPWFLTFSEMDGDCWENYNYFHNKEAVTKFFSYTPEIALSQMLDPMVINAMKDPNYKHASLTPLKNDFYQQYFPDIIPRPKYSGNEKMGKTKEAKQYLERVCEDKLLCSKIKSFRIEYSEFVKSLQS